MELEFAPHVEEIKRALDNEVDESNITADLKKLLEYRVPLSEAKRSLIRKYENGFHNHRNGWRDRHRSDTCNC